jgi:hypothetical protein
MHEPHSGPGFPGAAVVPGPDLSQGSRHARSQAKKSGHEGRFM